MQLLLNILVFNVWFPTGRKEENQRGGVTKPLNALEVTSARGEGPVTMAASLFVYTLQSEAAISNQCTNPHYLKDTLSTRSCASCFRNTCGCLYQGR